MGPGPSPVVSSSHRAAVPDLPDSGKTKKSDQTRGGATRTRRTGAASVPGSFASVYRKILKGTKPQPAPDGGVAAVPEEPRGRQGSPVPSKKAPRKKTAPDPSLLAFSGIAGGLPPAVSPPGKKVPGASVPPWGPQPPSPGTPTPVAGTDGPKTPDGMAAASPLPTVLR